MDIVLELTIRGYLLASRMIVLRRPACPFLPSLKENNDVPTLLIPSREDIERDSVALAWQGKGWVLCRLERFWEPPVLEHSEIRLYGDMTFCLFLSERLGLKLISPPDDLLLHVNDQWLGRNIRLTTLSAIVSETFPVFAKPVLPKQYRSAVYDCLQDLQTEMEGLPQETGILLSDIVRFTSEARCLVLNGRVLSTSIYEGTMAIDIVRNFAQNFVSNHNCGVTYILDVGWIDGQGMAVIEANAIWGGGLNGCDPQAMVECLEAATQH
jgi:hypothetical protein